MTIIILQELFSSNMNNVGTRSSAGFCQGQAKRARQMFPSINKG